MNIFLNGKTFEIVESISIGALLLSNGYKDKMVAVAVNGDFISKTLYETHMINDKDDIEIVAPMQGG